MSQATRVLYNADCPVCSFEIDHYRSYCSTHEIPLRFDDLNNKSALHDWGLSEDDAARRLYIEDAGQLYSGIPAFVVLWRHMPRYRWLARIVDVPGIRHVSIVAYDWLLAPAIYRWHLLRKRRAARLGNR